MKYENLISSICALAVIVAAIMKIMHLPHANLTLTIAFLATTGYQTWLVTQLKKRIKELENK